MIFPLVAPALVVVLDGSIVRSYNPPYLRNGHVVAPLEPYVTGVAARIGYSGSELIVVRGDRFAQISMRAQPPPGQWAQTYVEIAPILRGLGATIVYDAQNRRVVITSPQSLLIAPTPFNPAVPLSPVSAIFTPAPVATPRPQTSGKPAPRRTPLPIRCCPR